MAIRTQRSKITALSTEARKQKLIDDELRRKLGILRDDIYYGKVEATIPLRTVSAVTSDTTLDATYSIIEVDASANPVEVTLPLAADHQGRSFRVYVKDATFAVTAALTSSDTLNYETGPITIYQHETLDLETTSTTNWSA
jgi:hypothetical protein